MTLNKPLTKKLKIEAIDLIIANIHTNGYICNTYNDIIGRRQLSHFPELQALIDSVIEITDGIFVWHMIELMDNLPKDYDEQNPIKIKGKIIILKRFKRDLIKSTKSNPLIIEKYTKEYLIKLLN